jgi:hypothetical protein
MKSLVLTVVTLKIPVLLDLTLCRLAGSFWCSKGLYYHQKCALLGYCVASSGNFLLTFQNLSVPSSGIRNSKRHDLGQNVLQSLQNSHGHAKEFLYRQFGHAPSESIASPLLDCGTRKNKVLWFCKNIKTTSYITRHCIPEGQHWMMFMNILTFISDRSYCLCLFRAAEADAQRHIKKHNMTINQWTIRLFTVPCQPAYWGEQLTFIENFNWTRILLHTHTHTHSHITNTII